MTQYTLLAHRKDRMQALVQHDDEQAAYLYTFRRRLRYAHTGVKWTYQRVPLDFTVDQDTWETEYLYKVVLATTKDIHSFITGENAVTFATATREELGV